VLHQITYDSIELLSDVGLTTRWALHASQLWTPVSRLVTFW